MDGLPELAPLFVRVHTCVKNEKPRKSRRPPLPDKWARFALVFDCETTTDLRQNLTFLWWRFCELKNGVYICQEEGVVHADDLDDRSTSLISEFTRPIRADVEAGCPEKIRVSSRTEFVDGVFWDAIVAGAVIVCFNAPFDLSRLALEHREAKRKNTGWTLVLWKYRGAPDKLKPKLRIKPKDSRSAFISLAGGVPDDRVVYRGRFLDVSVLGWALRNRHMSLAGFLNAFGLKGKLDHEPTGLVTKRELQYGRRDTERTLALLNAMKHEYDEFPLRLAPEGAMSAASITKAFLDEMAITRPMKKFNIEDDIYGKCMQAYYGGRSEIRIRHHEVPIVVCDTTSEYPTVATLLRLWPLLIAAHVEVEECTQEAQNLLESLTLEKLFDPATWPKLAFFASVLPAGNTLPVRSIYDEQGPNANIGLNPLYCNQPIWYSGPDLAGSTLYAQSAPRVLRAFKFVPQGIQAGMKPSSLGGRVIDPATDDFFRLIIEERKKLSEEHPHYLLLKILANSLYGIFAELNKSEYGKNAQKRLQVFSGDHQHEESSFVVERPGRWHFPPAAALITAGGRLMLALLERLVRDRKGTYLLTDTDSMLFVSARSAQPVACPGGAHRLQDGSQAIHAISWNEVEGLCARLNSLNPYDPDLVKRILKIEDVNFDRAGKQHQLYGIAISAKRYAVYTRKNIQVQIIKPSEHGLGTLYVPDERKRYKPQNCKEQKTSYARWIAEVWQQLLAEYFLSGTEDDLALVARPLWCENLPAMMRFRITTPNVMQALREIDPAAGKPYNFGISPILAESPADCVIVAPFSKHPEDWLTQAYIDTRTHDSVKLGERYRGKILVPERISGFVQKYWLHPEDKSLAPNGAHCDGWTRGLLHRRPIWAMTPFQYIGKEQERRAQEGEDIAVIENVGVIRYGPRQTANTRAAEAAFILRAKRFSLRRLMRKSGVSQHAVERFLRGERVHPATRKRIAKAVEELEYTLRGRTE